MKLKSMAPRRNLPSIKALVTVEAAMRLRSFTAAARELNVTQAAVSRQVRVLEDDFGVALFTRGHRRVEPTPAGATLGLALSQALDTMADGVEGLRRTLGSQTLTVGATLAISHFWLLPRLSRFRERHPELRIRVLSDDEPFDLRSGGLDLVIRYGVAPFSDGRTLVSRDDSFFPVCSPAFAATVKAEPSATDLLSLPLIGHDAPDPTWMLWPDWFERVGVGGRIPPAALQVNHHTDGVAAALAGHGVALGWSVILHDLLATGQLVRIGAKVKADGAYNVVVPIKGANDAAEALAEWIGAMFAETVDEDQRAVKSARAP
jgi:LysR family transcriptional regulator, glycine cleavage system transcriptional activator